MSKLKKMKKALIPRNYISCFYETTFSLYTIYNPVILIFNPLKLESFSKKNDKK